MNCPVELLCGDGMFGDGGLPQAAQSLSEFPLATLLDVVSAGFRVPRNVEFN